jgi:adenylate cyclase
MELSKSQQLSVIIMLILSVVYFIAVNVNFFQRANFLLFDWQSTMLAEQLVADDDIIVIAIDDYSLTKMSKIAGRWPWPRTVHGQILTSLNDYSPAATGFDILFADKDIYRPDADLYFNEVLAQSPRVYLATLEQNISQGGGVLVSQLPKELALIQTEHAKVTAKASFVLPMAINQSNWQLGSINFTANIDGVGRYYDVYRDIDGWHMPSLPSKIIDALDLPLTDSQRILLQWRGNKFQPYKTLSYADVYTAAVNQNQQFLQQFNDKIILIGVTASGLFDARFSPINPHLPGVYILATAIDNLKNQTYLNAVNDITAQLLVILSIVLLGCCFNLVRNYAKQVSISFVLLVLFSIALILLSNTLLKQQQVLFVGEILIFMLVSFVSFSFVYGYVEYRHRQEALAMFSRFLDPNVVYKLLKDDALLPEQLNKKDTLTVLFSDIRNFTHIAENIDAQTLVNLLNDYFNQQVNIIFTHKGTLDKFIGDCLMAFWGAPEVSKNHATDAIRAALAMELQLAEFKKKLPENLQHFDVGIGIHTGECIVGMIGAKQRLDYTVIGDAVNLASRIEGLTKHKSRILISEQTKLLAEDDFDFIYQGEHKVKGRDALVKLYQPQHKVTSIP